MGRRARAIGAVHVQRIHSVSPVGQRAQHLSAWVFARCADFQRLLLVRAFEKNHGIVAGNASHFT